MLKNNLYVYGDENKLAVPSNLHYGEQMLRKFKEYGHNMAIINATTGESMTYAHLAQMTVDVALSLARMGVRKGDVISICSEERLEYAGTMIGIICAGATFTATDVSGKATITHRLNMVKPKVIFCSPETYNTQKDILVSVGSIERYILFGDERQEGATLFKDFLTETADVEEFAVAPVDGCIDFASILYSSGTTGVSKVVPMTHLNLLVHMLTKIDASYYRGQMVLTASEYYTYSLSCLHAGATILFIYRDRVQDILETVQKYKVKIMQQMPSTIIELVNTELLDHYDISSLERIVSASSPLRAHLAIAVKDRFKNLRDLCQIYGATELGVMCSDEIAPKGSKPESVGCATPGLVIKVVDLKTGEALGPNQHGEICVYSASLFPGYMGDTTFAHLDEEGFYKTGDVGYYDEDKYFFIVDRIKDIIKYHGFAVSPADLEAVLVSHPGVREAGVVGAPDPQYFELPTAFVVLQRGAELTEDELKDYVNSQVAHWMPLAGGVRFIPKMPRGFRGKIDRKALRQML